MHIPIHVSINSTIVWAVGIHMPTKFITLTVSIVGNAYSNKIIHKNSNNICNVTLYIVVYAYPYNVAIKNTTVWMLGYIFQPNIHKISLYGVLECIFPYLYP